MAGRPGLGRVGSKPRIANGCSCSSLAKLFSSISRYTSFGLEIDLLSKGNLDIRDCKWPHTDVELTYRVWIFNLTHKGYCSFLVTAKSHRSQDSRSRVSEGLSEHNEEWNHAWWCEVYTISVNFWRPFALILVVVLRFGKLSAIHRDMVVEVASNTGSSSSLWSRRWTPRRMCIYDATCDPGGDYNSGIRPLAPWNSTRKPCCKDATTQWVYILRIPNFKGYQVDGKW